MHYLTRVEVQALLDTPDPTTRAGLRDRAMLHIAFAAGLRVTEDSTINTCSYSDTAWDHVECAIHHAQ